MSSGSGSQPTQQQVTTTTSNLPEYARPYFQNLMDRAGANLNTEYQTYNAPRIAGFTPAQEQIQQNILGLQNPQQFATGSALAQQAGLGALNMRYDPSQFAAERVSGQYDPGQFAAERVFSQQVSAPTMQAAQTGYNPQIEQFRMAGPQMFGSEQAQQYMSPYIQNVLDVQKREAINDAKRGQLTQNLGAARQGAYGGSRQLLASMERERNLGQQMGDIQARGLQSAYESAQQQFERDRAAQMGVGERNLQAALQQQQLGVSTGLQTALANLSNEQQARVNNQAMQFQAQGMNAENAMRAALANQQQGMEAQRMREQSRQFGAGQGLQAALANQQQNLEAQRLGEQSRQFGASQGLAGLQLAGQMGQTLGNLGQYQQNANLQRLQAQSAAAAEQRQLRQQYLDQAYADFLRQRDYPMEVLGQYSNLLRGLPMQLNTTQAAYAPAPSATSQVLGAGLGALGMYKTMI